jgi:hypothetical protein
MTDRLSTLIALSERVQAATGADRELDADIFEAFGPIDEIHLRSWCKAGRPSRPRRSYIEAWALEYTKSIDEAAALLNRALPGWKWMASTCSGGPTASVHHEREGSSSFWKFTKVARAPTVPLALLSAMLDALIYIEEMRLKSEVE